MDLLSGYSDSGRPVPTTETFDDVLARAVAKTQEARGEEPAAEGQQPPAPTPRDPETGQFVAPGVTEPVVEETPAQSVQFEGESDDPEVAAFLAKYGATNVDPAALPPEVVKALKGGVEAQKLAGRHAKELGELRKQQAAAPEPGSATPQAAPAAPVAFPQQGEIEVAEQWVEEHGFASTAETLLGAYGRDDLYNILLDRAIRSGDPDLAGEAFQFNQWYEAQLQQQVAQATPPVAPAPAAQAPAPQSGDDLSTEEFQVTYERVKTNVPDFGTVEPLLEDALKAVPEETRQAFVSSVEAERELALYQVVNVARRLAAQQGAAAATGEARAQARVAAQVASGSLRPVGDGAPAEGTREAKIKAAKDAIFRGDGAFDLSKGYSGVS